MLDYAFFSKIALVFHGFHHFVNILNYILIIYFTGRRLSMDVITGINCLTLGGHQEVRVHTNLKGNGEPDQNSCTGIIS